MKNKKIIESSCIICSLAIGNLPLKCEKCLNIFCNDCFYYLDEKRYTDSLKLHRKISKKDLETLILCRVCFEVITDKITPPTNKEKETYPDWNYKKFPKEILHPNITDLSKGLIDFDRQINFFPI
jgi:hypothetical protein